MGTGIRTSLPQQDAFGGSGSRLSICGSLAQPLQGLRGHHPSAFRSQRQVRVPKQQARPHRSLWAARGSEHAHTEAQTRDRRQHVACGRLGVPHREKTAGGADAGPYRLWLRLGAPELCPAARALGREREERGGSSTQHRRPQEAPQDTSLAPTRRGPGVTLEQPLPP